MLVLFDFSTNFFLLFDHILSWQRGIVFLRRFLGAQHRAIALLFYNPLNLMWLLVSMGKLVDTPKPSMRGLAESQFIFCEVFEVDSPIKNLIVFPLSDIMWS